MIYAKEVLDRETQPYYWLTVYAHDSGAVALSSFVDVLIEVDDVNDNRPQTAQPVFYPTVMEGSREGTEVIQLQAFDHDIANGGLTYDITSGNPQGFFAIDRITGTLTRLSLYANSLLDLCVVKWWKSFRDRGGDTVSEHPTQLLTMLI